MGYRCFNGILLVFALHANAFGQQAVFHNYSYEQGLTTYNINKVVQDKFGFIWLATQDGIYRFDGKNFTVLKNYTTDNYPMQGNFYFDIAEGGNNDMYGVCFNGGIDVLGVNDLSIKSIRSSFPSLWFKRVFVDKNQTVWVGGKDFLAYKKQKDTAFSVVTKLDGFKDPVDVSCIKPVTDNHVAVIVNGYGMLIYDIRELRLVDSLRNFEERSTHRYGEMRDVLIDQDTVFVATDKGIFKGSFDDGNWTAGKFYPAKGFENCIVNCFVRDRKGAFWIGTNAGLIEVNIHSGQQIWYKANTSKKRWLLDNAINHLLIDNQENLWISTGKSLQRTGLRGNFIRHFSGEDTASDRMDHVYTLTKKTESAIFATGTDGLFLTDLISGRTKKIAGSDGLGVVHHIEQFEPDFWIVSCDMGVLGYSPTEGVLSTDLLIRKYPEWKNYKQYYFNNVWQNGDVSWWASEEQQGLIKWDRSAHSIRQYKAGTAHSAGLPENHIHNLKLDRKGRLWLLMDNYIVQFDTNKDSAISVIRYTREPGGPNAGVYFDLFDDGKTKWIGTFGGGLNGYNEQDGSWTYITEREGLCNNSVYSILPEKDSIIWVSTNMGISRVNYFTASCTNYYFEDGLQDNSFDEKGGLAIGRKLYFGGINGFAEVDLDKYEMANDSFPVYISKVEYYRGKEKVTINSLQWNKLILPSNTNFIAIYLSALTFANNHKIKFSYKIEGLHNDFIEAGEENVITLNSISYGEYQVIVRYRREDGSFVDNVLVLNLYIQPKYYQSVWFKVLAIVLVASGVYGLYRYRISQLKVQEKIRRQIAGDLHDDIGSTLNSIKVFSNVALMDPEKVEYLLRIKESTQNAITGTRDIMWVLDDKLDTLADLIDRFEQFAQPLAAASGIKLSKNIDPVLLYHKLRKEEKRNLFLILKESFNNCIKYSECSSFSYSIFSSKNKNLGIRIVDDGKGFDVTKAKNGNGLINMKDRARQIGYGFLVRSASGSGTEIEIFRQ
jgi:signal transduction histidine kinase/ligand-binding sensor domain-containing protein